MPAAYGRTVRQRRASNSSSAGPARKRRLAGLIVAATPAARPASAAHGPVCRLEGAHDEPRRNEQADHRREVGHRGEPERLGQELLDVPIVVVGRGRTGSRGRAPRPRTQPHRGRAVCRRCGRRSRRRRRARPARARATLRRMIAGRKLTYSGPKSQPSGTSGRTQPKPTDVGGSSAVAEQPGARRVPDLVAALVVDPAVVADREGKREDGQPLNDDECREDGARPGVEPGRGASAISGSSRRGPRPARPALPPASQPTACACACSRYHATVCSRPSRSAVARAEAEELLAPGRRRASAAAGRSASTCPRRSRPSKPVISATSSASSRIEISTPGAEVDRLGAVVALGGEHEVLRRSRRRRGTRASACRRPRARPRPFASSILRISAAITCAALEIEVVARAVEVRRQQVDGVQAVLLAVGLAADEHRLLRDAVRRVRLLRIAVPEVVLAERHRRVLRVGADRAGDDELPDLVQPCSARARAHP